MMRLLVGLLLMGLCGTARADTMNPLIVEKSLNQARLGLGLSLAGPPVMLAGGLMVASSILAEEDEQRSGAFVLGGAALAGGGFVATIGGPVLLSYASIRGAKHTGTRPTLGWVSVGLQGVYSTMVFAYPWLSSPGMPEQTEAAYSAVAQGARIGMLTCGMLQNRQNRLAYRAAYPSSAQAAPRVRLSLAPRPDGLQVVGQF